MQSNLALTTLVCSALLTTASLPAMAVGVGGDETNVNESVPSPMWTVLVQEPFETPPGVTHCVATGSLDAMNPNMGDDNRYAFVLSMDAPTPPIDGACERTVEFDQHAPDAQKVEEVSSTCTFRNIEQGAHVIYWLARQASAGAPPMTVLDSSMTFVCDRKLLDHDGEADGH